MRWFYIKSGNESYAVRTTSQMRAEVIVDLAPPMAIGRGCYVDNCRIERER